MAVDKEFMAKVKELRKESGAGFMDCRKALEEAQGDMDKARKILKQKGLKIAEKKAGREAREGVIASYIHFSSRFGSLVEINCETDFVARTDGFKTFANDVALQIAGMCPKYITREDVPEEEIARLREEFEETIASENIPDDIKEKRWQGKLESFYREYVLLDQPFVKDQSKTMKELLTEAIARFGENIVIRRFVRFELGEV